jgi:hypothetical protein
VIAASGFKPSPVVLGEEELKRLHPILRQIVEHQRTLDEICEAKVVGFLEAREALARRNFLARSAEREFARNNS